jgi:hypothetical protein
MTAGTFLLQSRARLTEVVPTERLRHGKHVRPTPPPAPDEEEAGAEEAGAEEAGDEEAAAGGCVAGWARKLACELREPPGGGRRAGRGRAVEVMQVRRDETR